LPFRACIADLNAGSVPAEISPPVVFADNLLAVARSTQTKREPVPGVSKNATQPAVFSCCAWSALLLLTTVRNHGLGRDGFTVSFLAGANPA